MEEQKSWYASTTIWGGAVAAVAGLAGIFGYTISPADQAALSDSIGQIVTLVTSVSALGGGLLAIWGRVRASKTIATKSA
ncbi:MAG: hypothetical protein KF904_00020 [Rhodoblastus sp.]|nr:hypothetical protein [Rhodoblastus sp.]